MDGTHADGEATIGKEIQKQGRQNVHAKAMGIRGALSTKCEKDA